MNYKDLGFDGFLNREQFTSDFRSTSDLVNIEGMDASQILRTGRIQSPDNQWYIDFNTGEINLPNNSVKDQKIVSMSMDKLIAGTIGVVGFLGDTNIELDGENRRILIYDNTNTPRILIGYQENGF